MLLCADTNVQTSRGPSHAARWLPFGDNANDANEDVGRGKCWRKNQLQRAESRNDL